MSPCRFVPRPFLRWKPQLVSCASFAQLKVGGDERVRTDDPLLAKQVLSQLSYTPTVIPAFVLLPFESTVSSTLKTIQCNLLKLEFVFYAVLNRDRLEHFFVYSLERR